MEMEKLVSLTAEFMNASHINVDLIHTISTSRKD